MLRVSLHAGTSENSLREITVDDLMGLSYEQVLKKFIGNIKWDDPLTPETEEVKVYQVVTAGNVRIDWGIFGSKERAMIYMKCRVEATIRRKVNAELNDDKIMIDGRHSYTVKELGFRF